MGRREHNQGTTEAAAVFKPHLGPHDQSSGHGLMTSPQGMASRPVLRAWPHDQSSGHGLMTSPQGMA